MPVSTTKTIAFVTKKVWPISIVIELEGSELYHAARAPRATATLLGAMVSMPRALGAWRISP